MASEGSDGKWVDTWQQQANIWSGADKDKKMIYSMMSQITYNTYTIELFRSIHAYNRILGYSCMYFSMLKFCYVQAYCSTWIVITGWYMADTGRCLI